MYVNIAFEGRNLIFDLTDIHTQRFIIIFDYCCF